MQNIRQNLKTYYYANNIKMENNEFIKGHIKNCTYYYFDDINNFEDFDSDRILIDEKSRENFLIYDISFRAFIGPKNYVLGSIK